MVGIIGSGFALYGYLPIVVQRGEKAVLLIRSKSAFEARPELLPYKKDISWCEDEDQLIRSCTELIICVPPASQMEILGTILKSEIKPKYLIIEKPVAPTPEISAYLVSKLNETGINYRIAYTFLYTEWIKKLQEIINHSDNQKLKYEIGWSFEAYHFKHNIINWKRFNREGGGVIRFYGIHLIALLSIIGFDQILRSTTYEDCDDEPFSWNLEVTNSIGSTAEITVNCHALISTFFIKAFHTVTNEVIFRFDAEDPFYSKERTQLDKRTPTLSNMYIDLKTHATPPFALYNSINNFWMNIEFLNNSRQGEWVK